MKKTTKKRGSVFGTALSPVPPIALCAGLMLSTGLFINESNELDKAREEIVQYESSLKHQMEVNTGLEKDLSALEKSQMDLTSKNDTLLKDNAKLNQKLKSEGEKNSQLQQKLKQTELQARELQEELQARKK